MWLPTYIGVAFLPRFVLLFAFLLAIAVTAFGQAQNTKASPSVSRLESTVIYDGFLNGDGLQKLSEMLNGDGISELHINSPGGEIGAGIQIGSLVFEKGLDVVIPKMCASSCANYVFTAGRRKKIQQGAIVFWHGSALQKNFRESLARIVEKINTSGLEKLSDVERRYFETRTITLSMQKDFFEKIKVNEYVTRLGQEPINYKVSWTISIADMERFGIRDVDGPPSYGSPSYCSDWVAMNKLPVKCLELTPQMIELIN